MISYFPSIHPDELLYSQLARYYAKSGYLAYTFAAEDLFQSKTVRPDIEFLNAYTSEALQMITRTMPMEAIVMHHTMFPYYGRFIPPERRRQAFDSLINMETGYHNLLSIPKRKDRVSRHLRYCPECVNDDRLKYGETFWHRMHQMVGVNICPVHHCHLIESDIVTSSNVSPSLITAEEVAELPEKITYSDNDLECRLAEYVAEVFQSDVDLQSNVTTGRFLHSCLEGTKYLSKRGEQRNMSLLHADFIEFYGTFPNNEFNQQWQLGKVFSNDRHNTLEICMLAIFLGVSVHDLVHMELPEKTQIEVFEESIRDLHTEGLNYRQIANHLNASYDVVKSIGEGLYGTYHYFSANPQKGGIGTIERYLNLPKNGLRNYPMCRAEIQRHAETQEQYWTRELIWAAKTITDSGQPLHLTAIKKITNMRSAYITACIPYLDMYGDTQIVAKIRGLL